MCGSSSMQETVSGSGRCSSVPRLGFDVVELFCTPDGSFPNHHPDPTVLESLELLTKSVKENGADLGIAFDGMLTG